jgi:hypothetical protein
MNVISVPPSSRATGASSSAGSGATTIDVIDVLTKSAGTDCVAFAVRITAVVSIPPTTIAHAAAAAIFTFETNMLMTTPFIICAADEVVVAAAPPAVPLTSCESVTRFIVALPSADGAIIAPWCARQAPIVPTLAAASPMPCAAK